MARRQLDATTRLSVKMVIAALFLGTTAALAPAPASAQTYFPEVMALPNGWQPEGIANGPGRTMLSGSRVTGDVVAVDIVTGESRLFVDAPPGRTAIGLELDRWGRLWVAGGATGQAYVYAPDGTPLATYQLGSSPTFINDVVITRDAAWFTDSQKSVLYKIPIALNGSLGQPVVVPLTGDYQHAPGFNLNGIEVTPDGRWLIAVQSNTGALYRIDPRSGAAVRIDLDGAVLQAGDGILFHGRRLYVVQNVFNQVAVVDLDPRTWASGEVVDALTSPNFDAPTTIASFGNHFYLVNARFPANWVPGAPYNMVSIPRR
ncbi:MAG: superoxide dismutase [Actinobacteria bacterium]|nr:superoxide dismutase [Actinomycetota bacterium]